MFFTDMINTIREIKDLKISSGLLNSLNFKINTQPGENLPDYANNNSIKLGENLPDYSK